MRQQTRRQIQLASTIRVASGHMPHKVTRRDFVWSHGVLQLVARSGTVVPGVGEVAHLVMGVLVVIGNTAFVTHADRFEAIRRQYQQWVTQMLPLPASS